MKKLAFVLFLLTTMAFSQNKSTTDTYKYGQNGMELIARSKKGTVIISTFHSKMNIRQEIANKVYALYVDNKLETNKNVTVKGDMANVTGKCVIRKKKNLILVDFYYETVEWRDGFTEIHSNHLG